MATPMKKEPEAPPAEKPVRAVARPMVRMERDLEHFFDRFFEDFRPRWSSLFHRPERWLEHGVLAATDVFEEKDDIVVKAELPGMAKEDLEITLEGTTLTVKGEKKREEEVKEDAYHRVERSYGSVVRVVELPAEVKADQVKATFKNGVLEIRMPKSEAAKQRQTKISVQ